jgi:HEAT repeat protein
LWFDQPVVIRVSSARQVDGLITELSSDENVKRDAAAARLTVLGARAVGPLMTLADNRDAPARGRAGALRVLEAIGDPRSLDAALRLVTHSDDEIAMAAIDVARVFIRSPNGVPAVDRLSAVSMDQQRPVPIRLAAIRALRDLPAATVKPLLAAIKSDPVPEIAAAAEQGDGDLSAVLDPLRCIEDAARGVLPDEASVLRRAIGQIGNDTPLPALQAIVDRVREREAGLPRSRRADWTTARAAAHLALARRGSRLALYDLRETFESATEPLPVEFVTTASEVGDASCLEPLAAAYGQTAGGRHRQDWWPRHLSGAFRAIVARERITRRHAIMRKIEKRWGLGIFD